MRVPCAAWPARPACCQSGGALTSSCCFTSWFSGASPSTCDADKRAGLTGMQQEKAKHIASRQEHASRVTGVHSKCKLGQAHMCTSLDRLQDLPPAGPRTACWRWTARGRCSTRPSPPAPSPCSLRGGWVWRRVAQEGMHAGGAGGWRGCRGASPFVQSPAHSGALPVSSRSSRTAASPAVSSASTSPAGSCRQGGRCALRAGGRDALQVGFPHDCMGAAGSRHRPAPPLLHAQPQQPHHIFSWWSRQQFTSRQ